MIDRSLTVCALVFSGVRLRSASRAANIVPTPNNFPDIHKDIKTSNANKTKATSKNKAVSDWSGDISGPTRSTKDGQFGGLKLLLSLRRFIVHRSVSFS
jgi:hypothetical protein